jgi:hypothetical protein
MTNAPESRKTHVIRILGTNKAGDVLPDIWADIERIDKAKTVSQSADINWQGTVQRLKWQDDPDGDDFSPDGPPSRKTTIVKVCSPDEPDQSDPEEWIPIPVIDAMRMVTGDQGGVRRFINDKPTDGRIVKQRRILHYDTSIDDRAQAAFDADPTRKVFVVPGDQYTRDDSSKDDSQYVEHEIITFLKGRESDETGTGQGDDQGKQTKLLNQYLIDESEEAKLDVVGDAGINPPWRLDPFQNIVNVQMGGATRFPMVGTAIPDVLKTPANLPSTSVFTVSMMFRFNKPTGPNLTASLLFINNTDDINDNGGVQVDLVYFPGGLGLDADIIFDVFVGAKDTTSVAAHSNFLTSDFYAEDKWAMEAQGLTFCQPGVFQPSGWNHLLFSVNTAFPTVTGAGFLTESNGVAFPVSSAPIIDLRLNGIQCFTYEIVPYSLNRSQFMSTNLSRIDNITQFVGATLNSDNGDQTVLPPFKIGFDTATLRIPGATGGFSNFESLDLSDVYVWTDQAIPSAQYVNFIRPVGDGKSVAAPKSSIVDIYGEPDYLFTGSPKKFVTNGGTAGPVTGVDLEDFLKSTSKPKLDFT